MKQGGNKPPCPIHNLPAAVVMPPSVVAITSAIMRPVIAAVPVTIARLIIMALIIRLVIDRLVIGPVIIPIIGPVIASIIRPVIGRCAVADIDLRMASMMMPVSSLCRASRKGNSDHCKQRKQSVFQHCVSPFVSCI
jgi:hypothetical protein